MEQPKHCEKDHQPQHPTHTMCHRSKFDIRTGSNHNSFFLAAHEQGLRVLKAIKGYGPLFGKLKALTIG
jgi:hypothetical protein